MSYNRFAELLAKNNVNAYKVAKETGISTATLTEWKKGTYTPKADKLILIAKYFNVPLDFFYQEDETVNEIAIREEPQLPDTIEDLTQFVLVGKANLNAYLLKLQTVNRLSVAQEIRDQTLREAQEISTALIAAEQKIGELLLAIPTSQGRRTDKETSVERSTKVETKNQTIERMGYGTTEAKDYQQMAKNPEVVQKVIDEAMERGEVVTKASVMREIKFYKDRIATLEKQKTQTVEVVPDDYKEAKKRARTAEAEKKQLEDKLLDSYRKQRKLEDQIRDLKEVTKEGLDHENLSENVYFFCTTANNFVGNVGGLVWLTEHIAEMPEKERDLFLKASAALQDFANVFNQNLRRALDERNGETGKHDGYDDEVGLYIPVKED